MTGPTATAPHPFALAAKGATGLAGGVTCLLPVLWALDPFGIIRTALVQEQVLALTLAAALAFVLWSRIGRAGPLGNAALLLGGAGAVVLGLSLAAHFGGAGALFIAPTPPLLALTVLATVLIATALVMTAGLPLSLLLLAVVAFGFIAQFLPAPLDAPRISAARYTVYFLFGGNGFLGSALKVIASTVVIFILFGAAYELSGGTDAIDRLARHMSRRGKGMAIKATILSSALFGMVSGSATSNVLTSGAFTITAMRKLGLSSKTAGGIEAVSSTMGQVTPPVMGAAAFIMADLTGMPYASIALAAAVPALLCFAVMFHQGTWLGHRLESSDPDAPREAVPQLFWSDLWHLVPVLVISVLMFRGDRMTELAGIGGTAAALATGLVLHGPRTLWHRLRATAAPTASAATGLVVAGAALGAIVGVLGLTGLDVSMTLAIRTLAETSLFLSLLATAFVALVLGTGMATTGVYVVVGTLLAPGLVDLGVPLIAAHLFVLYFGMVSMITPPVAFAALAASGISGASFSGTAWASMRFGWVIYVVPFAFVYAPGLLLVGPPEGIAVALGSAASALVLAGWFVSLPPDRTRANPPMLLPALWLALLALSLLPLFDPTPALAPALALQALVLAAGFALRRHARAPVQTATPAPAPQRGP